MTTVTDDLQLARQTLVETDEFTSVELPFKSSEISVETGDGRIWATMAVEGEPHKLSAFAIKQLATALQVPANYLVRCGADLQAQNLHYWQQKLSDRKRIRALVGHGELQAITSPNFIPVHNVRIFDALVEQVGAGNPEDAVLEVFEHSWESTRIGLTNKNASHKVDNSRYQHTVDTAYGSEVEDVVRAGVNFRNSLINANYTELEPFAFRLVCKNRMVSPLFDAENPRFRFKNDGSLNADDWIREAVDLIGQQFEPLFAAIDHAASTPLEDAEQVVRDHLHNVPGTIREEVINAWREEPLPTQWGVVNAFTRAATHAEEVAPNHRLQTERHAGWFATAPDVCSTCGRADGHGPH